MIIRLLTILLLLSSLYLFSLWQTERSTQIKLEEQLILNSSQDNNIKVALTPIPEPSATPEHKETAFVNPTEQPLPIATIELNNKLSEMALYGIESRISAIQKFSPLDETQKERLYNKYRAESLAKKRGVQIDTESLGDIIGEANAQFYRSQVENAYKKAQEQELDRDVFYLSRRLNLTSDQEQKYRQILSDLESNVSEHFRSERSSSQFASDPSYRVRLTIKEQQYRSDWLSNSMKSILSPDQYQAFLQEEAESTNADMGIFHAP